MAIVIVERQLEPATTFAALQAAEDAVAWCLEQHRVRFDRSYLSLDGRSMICVYAAPDAEAVRETQRRGGLPTSRVWTARIAATTGRHAASAGFSTVVVERELSTPVEQADVDAMFASAEGCLKANRAELLESKLSLDRTRMLCLFQAPDAEAVRRANRQSELPFSRVWTASVHGR